MAQFLTTKEVARFLNVNEKMVYGLVSDKGLPASKITGKWLFPKNLVEQWVEINTINYPNTAANPTVSDAVLIISGSNDLLLDKVISLYNTCFPGNIAVFGNLGSMGGLQALRQNLCHIASSHLLGEDGRDYNFEFASRELDYMPAVINFCRREQGIMVTRGNPKNIQGITDLGQTNVRIVNRPLSAGTRVLLDQELKKAGLDGEKLNGYRHEVHRHLDVGLEILAGRADAGLGIHAVASLLNLDFIPLCWERYDLLIFKERFFEASVQQILGLLHDERFNTLVNSLEGYDVSLSGRMIYPTEKINEDNIKNIHLKRSKK